MDVTVKVKAADGTLKDFIVPITLASNTSTWDHIVIAVMENHAQQQIIGNSGAPYLTSLANANANFTQSFGVAHPSQPNYLALFSGSVQGVTDDNHHGPFAGTNIASQLAGIGKTFIGYSEGLPSVGYTGDSSGGYARKHNPWVQFSNIPSTSNQPFTAFPTDYTKLPTVSWVIPNLTDDMHDGTVSQGDTWLKNNLDPYVNWAKTHNSLLIITFDEDDYNSQNHIATIMAGANVKQGAYSETIDHYSVLGLVQDAYKLPRTGGSVGKAPITDAFATAPVTPPPATGAVWGVYDGLGHPYDTGDVDYINTVGAIPAVGISYYSMYDGELPNPQETDRAARGTITQASLESKSYKQKDANGVQLRWTWQDIAAGKYDAQYVAYAKKVAALDVMYIVCPDHEGDEQINNNLRPGQTGADYAAAWLHVKSVMAPIAPKIKWAFWMGGYKTSTMAACYPGDSNVDLVGVDPYRSKSHSATETCRQTWASRIAGLDTFVGPDVPRALTETATDIASGGIPNAAAWWDGVAAEANRLGLLYVNFYNRHGDGDWQIDQASKPYPDVVAAVKRQITLMPGRLIF